MQQVAHKKAGSATNTAGKCWANLTRSDRDKNLVTDSIQLTQTQQKYEFLYAPVSSAY